MKKFLDVIKSSNNKQIRELHLFLLPTNNPQADVSILPNITEKLVLWLRYEADVEFCRKLKTEILNFDTNKLQTEMVGVVVMARMGEKWRYLIFELRKGESPRLVMDQI